MATDPIPPLLDQLAGHPRRDDLARLVREAIARAVAAGTQRIDVALLLEGAAKLGIERKDAELPLGNVLGILEAPADGPEGGSPPGDRALLAALFARAMSVELAAGASQEKEVAEGIAWLVAAADKAHPPVRDEASTKPGVQAASEAPAPPLTRSLHGEVVAAPHGPVVTALLALSGYTLARGLAYLVARFVLSFRRSAEVRLSQDGGLLLRTRTEMLHRALRERETIVPRDALVRASREVRFPSLPMYAGLLALLLGSYVGVGLVVDGLRAASLSLFATGLLIVLIGLGLDFVLTSLLPGTRGRCRVLFVPRRGPALCIGEIEREDADRFLGELAKR